MGNILIVDNDEGLIHFLTRLFVKQGHEVASCTDGISALERIKAQPFDLILLDYKMPGLNGLETLVEIKNAQIKTPVIVMTAYGTTDETRRLRLSAETLRRRGAQTAGRRRPGSQPPDEGNRRPAQFGNQNLAPRGRPDENRGNQSPNAGGV
jgi:CheY-like chemotaxis protein